jgi:hypothetical protein
MALIPSDCLRSQCCFLHSEGAEETGRRQSNCYVSDMSWLSEPNSGIMDSTGPPSARYAMHLLASRRKEVQIAGPVASFSRLEIQTFAMSRRNALWEGPIHGSKLIVTIIDLLPDSLRPVPVHLTLKSEWSLGISRNRPVHRFQRPH